MRVNEGLGDTWHIDRVIDGGVWDKDIVNGSCDSSSPRFGIEDPRGTVLVGERRVKEGSGTVVLVPRGSAGFMLPVQGSAVYDLHVAALLAR